MTAERAATVTRHDMEHDPKTCGCRYLGKWSCGQVEIPTTRPLYEIAREIRKDWTSGGKKVYFGAVPYLDAMETLNQITEDYFCDSGESIVVYFLANAQTWKGETARRVKAELNKLLKGA
jgi:hypothetical protein